MAEEYGLANLLSGQPLPTDTSELGQIVGGGETAPSEPSPISTLPPGYRMMRLPNGASVPVYKDYSDADAMALIREQHPELFEKPKPAHKPIPRGHAAAQEEVDPTFEKGQRYPAFSKQDVIDYALAAENQPDLAAPEEIPLAYKFAPTAEQRAQIQKAKQAEAQPRDPEKQGFLRAAGAGLAREVGSLGRFVSESAEPFAPEFARTVKGLTRPVEERAQTIYQPISDIELAEAKQKGMLPYTQAQLSRAGEVLGGFAGEWGLPSAVAIAGKPGRALSTGMTFGQLYGDLSRRAEEAGVQLSLPEKYAGAALSTAIFQLAPNFITKGIPISLIAPSAREIATIYEREGLEAAQNAVGSLAGNIAKSYLTGTVGATGAMVGTEAVTRQMLGQPMPTFKEAAEMATDAAIISGPMSILHGRAATKEQRGAYLDAATREFRQNAQARQRAAEIQAENEARVWPEMRTGTARDQAPPTTERISAEAVPPTPPPIQEEAAPTDLSALPSEDIEVNLTKLKEQSNAFMDANDFDSYDLTQTAIEQHEAELRRREAEGLAAGQPPKEEAAPAPYYEQLGLSPKNKTVLNALKELDINNPEHHATIAKVLDEAINNPRLKVKDVDAMTALRDQLQPPEVPDAQQITEAGAPDGGGSAQPVFREEGGDQAVGGKGVEPSGQGVKTPEALEEEEIAAEWNNSKEADTPVWDMLPEGVRELYRADKGVRFLLPESFYSQYDYIESGKLWDQMKQPETPAWEDLEFKSKRAFNDARQKNTFILPETLLEPSKQGEQAAEVGGEEVQTPEEKVVPQSPREAWETMRSEGEPEHKALLPEAQKLWREAFDEGAADQSLFNMLKKQVPTEAARQQGEVEVAPSKEDYDADEFLYSKKAVGEKIPTHIDIDGVKRPTTNNKGAPIHPTEEGVRNFWKWFGDSKAVDAEGRPLVMYHGTQRSFDEFDPSGEGTFGRGVYLTGLPERTGQYTKQRADMTGGNVMPVYLKIANPSELTSALGIKPTDKESANKFTALQQRLIKKGHDGSLSWLGKDVWEAVAFSPEQIKSAIGNEGAFSPTEANILKARGVVPKQAHTAESLKEELGKLYGKNVPEIEVSTRDKEGVDEDVQGFFDPKTKRAVLIADNIEKGEDIHGLLRHEVAVHLKKLGATDAEFQGFLRQLEALRDKGATDVVEAFRRVPKGTKAEDVTHEALAYLSQHKPNLPIVRRFMSWMRRNAYDLTGNAKWLKGDDFAVMADEVLSGKRTAKAEVPEGEGVMATRRGEEEPRKGAVFTTFDRRSVNKTIGNAISRVLKATFDPTAMGKEYAKIRRQLVAESAGLTKALESMPTYDPETGIRVDYLRNQYDSAYQMAQEGVFNGVPVLNKSTGLARIQNSSRFNLDRIVADAGKVPLTKNFFGEKATPLEVMSDIFRIKMGEQELKEVADARSKLARMERLPAETRRQDDVKEAMQDLRTLIADFEAGEGRERLVKDEHIMWANQLIARTPEAQDIFDRWMGVNSALVKFAKDSNWITPEQAEIWDERPYVPLLKSLEALAEAKGDMPSYPGGGPKATGKIFGKKGSLQDVNIFENLVRHYAYMMGNSMMNNVKHRAFEQLNRLGLAERVPPNYKGKDAVKVKDAGKDMLFKVNDEEAFRSLTMANMASIPLIELAAIPSNWLRTHSLVNPLYWERTFFREPVTANFVTTAKGLLGPVTPLDAGYEIGKILLGLSKEGKELKSYGVSGYATSQGMYDRFAKGIAATPKARKWTELMGHIHTSFDEGTRALIYKSAKKEAAKDGITDPEVINDIAAVKAREFADFAAKGSSQTVRQFAKLTPFFHAQLVGMDKMLRSATGAGLAGKEKERLRNRFISNAVIMSSAAMMYALVNMQDSRYRDLPIREWAHNYIAGFDEEGHGLKIPIPQELGFFFKFLPELSMRSIMGLTDAPEAKKAFSQMFSETVVPPGLLDPTAVAFRGYLQLQTNKELHSELPIDSPQEMLGLPEDRDKRATLFGKAMVEGLNKVGIDSFSPNQFDSFMRSMFSVNYELAAMSAAMIWDAYTGKRGLFELPFNKDITERYPGARGLFTNPRNISATPRFYDMARPLYQTMYSINRAYEGEGEDSVARLKELTSDSTMMMRYNMVKVATDYRTKISEIEKAIEKLDKRKDISEAEKRRLYWARIKDRNELARKGLEEISLGMANDKKFKRDMDRPDTEHIEVTTDMLMREIGRFEEHQNEDNE